MGNRTHVRRGLAVLIGLLMLLGIWGTSSVQAASWYPQFWFRPNCPRGEGCGWYTTSNYGYLYVEVVGSELTQTGYREFSDWGYAMCPETYNLCMLTGGTGTDPLTTWYWTDAYFTGSYLQWPPGWYCYSDYYYALTQPVAEPSVAAAIDPGTQLMRYADMEQHAQDAQPPHKRHHPTADESMQRPEVQQALKELQQKNPGKTIGVVGLTYTDDGNPPPGFPPRPTH